MEGNVTAKTQRGEDLLEDLRDEEDDLEGNLTFNRGVILGLMAKKLSIEKEINYRLERILAIRRRQYEMALLLQKLEPEE